MSFGAFPPKGILLNQKKRHAFPKSIKQIDIIRIYLSSDSVKLFPTLIHFTPDVMEMRFAPMREV
jgi:hypothetical protein